MQNGSPIPEEVENDISWPIRDEFRPDRPLLTSYNSRRSGQEFVLNRPGNSIFEFFRSVEKSVRREMISFVEQIDGVNRYLLN